MSSIIHWFHSKVGKDVTNQIFNYVACSRCKHFGLPIHRELRKWYVCGCHRCFIQGLCVYCANVYSIQWELQRIEPVIQLQGYKTHILKYIIEALRERHQHKYEYWCQLAKRDYTHLQLPSQLPFSSKA